MSPGPSRRCFAASALVLLGASAALHAFGQADRARAREMVDGIKQVIRESYYDPAFRGIDLDAHFARVRARLDTAESFGQAFALIGQSLLDFQDSHTFFLPPTLITRFDYGWRMQAIGDRCYVVAVNPAGDAAAKGLRPGDQLLRIQATTPTRGTMWRTKYQFYSLYPQPVVTLLVNTPRGERREFVVAASTTKRPRFLELLPEDLDRPLTINGDQTKVERESVRIGTVTLWKLPTFEFPAADVDDLVDGATKGAGSLVLDLRGNRGGYITTLERIASRLFDRRVTLGTRIGRKPMPPIVATPRRPFAGALVVLVDSDSSSSAEILARAVQLEGRGIVIGDRSAGRVMQSRTIAVPLAPEGGELTFFYVSVTEADVLMADNRSLEHVGVTPDELLLPTPADLAAGRDPVLARAAARLGLALDPTVAGAMFPITWK